LFCCGLNLSKKIAATIIKPNKIQSSHFRIQEDWQEIALRAIPGISETIGRGVGEATLG
jgi:hypothetical protein